MSRLQRKKHIQPTRFTEAYSVNLDLIQITDEIRKEILDFLDDMCYVNKPIDYVLDQVRMKYRFQLDITRDEFVELVAERGALMFRKEKKKPQENVLTAEDIELFKYLREIYDYSNKLKETEAA